MMNEKAITPETVLVKGGNFERVARRFLWKNRLHNIEVSDFHIGKYPVTTAEFRIFINETNYRTDTEERGFSLIWNGAESERREGVNWECDYAGKKYDNRDLLFPVLHISRNDAEHYCAWLSRFTGAKYRLPTEAEWEFAARGGNSTRRFRYSGSNALDDVGWYRNNADGALHPAGTLKPNELGIYDMSGNCWELCSDYFDKEYYMNCESHNPKGPQQGDYNVIRGGAFYLSAPFASLFFRASNNPAEGEHMCGFRVACNA